MGEEEGTGTMVQLGANGEGWRNFEAPKPI